MDLRIFIEPQLGASYETQLALARRAEDLGFDAFFRSDHFLRSGAGDPLPGPTDSWITLAGLARETSRIRLGTLVTSATFRLPGMLAVQDPLPIIIGGGGARKTPALAARFAHEFNQAFPEKSQVPELRDRVRRACEEIGRDPDSLVQSLALTTVVGTDDAEFARRAAAIGSTPERLRERGIAGTPGQVVETLRGFAEQGITRVYLQCLDMDDLEHLDLIAEEVMPHVA